MLEPLGRALALINRLLAGVSMLAMLVLAAFSPAAS